MLTSQTLHLGPDGTQTYTSSIAECVEALFRANVTNPKLPVMLVVEWDGKGYQCCRVNLACTMRMAYDQHDAAWGSWSDNTIAFWELSTAGAWLAHCAPFQPGEDMETSFRLL